jgi:predicted P-loop ATPase
MLKPSEIAHEVRRTMPACWREAACVYRLSASAGVHGWDKVSLHLWFWLDRPVYDKSLKAYAKREGFNDSCLFSAVQVHYTADPIFVGMTDPVAERLGRLSGLPEVKVPAQIKDHVGWLQSQEIKPTPMPVIAYADDRQKTLQEQYALKALEHAAEEIRAQGKGNRNPEAHKQAYSIGGYVGAGVLDAGHAQAVLTAAIQSVVEPSRYGKEADTVARGLADGAANPRDMSHIGQPKPRMTLVKGAKVGNLAVKNEEEQAPEVKAEKKPEKKTRKKGGPEWVDLDEKDRILSTAPNFAALTDWMGYRPRRNLMSHQTEWEGAPSDIALECRQNAMAGVIIDEALRNGWRMSKENFGMHLGVVEARRAFHPVVDWVKSRPWDGRSRFGDLFDTLTIRDSFAGVRDLLRCQLDKWLISGGRCLALGSQSPDGVAAQGVLVVQGPQNLGKTRWFKAMLPDSSWFSEGLTMDPSNKDHVIQGTATFMCELGELDATTRKSDVAQLKAFLTRSVDVYRSPYGKHREVYARRTIFGATVNPDAFLVDDTGNRRFWVMPVSAVNADHGLDMQQIWAEAMARADAGEMYWMPDEYKADQLRLASNFESRSEWADDFFKIFRLPVGDEPGQVLRVSDVRSQVMPDRNWSVQDMKSFTQFLGKIKARTSVRQGVNHVTLVRW